MLLQARENEVEPQEVERSIKLTRTEAAPTNAVGTAQLEVGYHSASRSNRVEIHTSGLAAGIYAVTVFDRSGTNGTVLGTFLAGGSAEDSGDDSGHGRGRGRGGKGASNDEGEASFAVAGSINALDLGRVSITDGAGNEMLAGDFSDLSAAVSGRILSRVFAVNGEADDDASGVAAISGRIRRGRGNGLFKLTGQGLPPRSVLTLNINGEDQGPVRTDRRGRMRVSRNQRSLDVFSISTVSVRDDSGGEVLKAQF